MRADLTEIIFILDKSGSMEPLIDDAVGGFNVFVEEQRKQPGEARLTLILFANSQEAVITQKPLARVPALTRETYRPMGGTALYDAVGHTITAVGKRLSYTPEAERPGKVVVAIFTDGEENSSHSFTHGRVAEMIAHQQGHYGWLFTFLGANMDAVEIAANLNIPRAQAANFMATREGTQEAYATVSSNVSMLRAGVPFGTEQEEEVAP